MSIPDHVKKIVAEMETDIGDAGSPDDLVEIAETRRERAVRHDRGGSVEQAVRRILTEIGEDPDRQGLLRTPERMHRMYLELTAGKPVQSDRLLNRPRVLREYHEMGIVKGNEVFFPLLQPY